MKIPLLFVRMVNVMLTITLSTRTSNSSPRSSTLLKGGIQV